MSQAEAFADDLEPDIVTIMLQRVIAMAPGFSAALASQIEQQLRAEYGGKRLHINKRGKRMTPEQRQAVFQDGLTTMTTAEITTKHKISRATLYRTMNQAGRFGS